MNCDDIKSDFKIINKINCFKQISLSFPLLSLKKENINDFNLMMKAIEEIYNCKDSIDILNLNSYKSLNDKRIDGLEYETILKVIKWLFIEQDITYWSFSGRSMLYNYLSELK